ncbi:MAG: hypothetical protein R3F33_15700 [Planctomycetota bacterium]
MHRKKRVPTKPRSPIPLGARPLAIHLSLAAFLLSPVRAWQDPEPKELCREFHVELLAENGRPLFPTSNARNVPKFIREGFTKLPPPYVRLFEELHPDAEAKVAWHDSGTYILRVQGSGRRWISVLAPGFDPAPFAVDIPEQGPIPCIELKQRPHLRTVPVHLDVWVHATQADLEADHPQDAPSQSSRTRPGNRWSVYFQEATSGLPMGEIRVPVPGTTVDLPPGRYLLESRRYAPSILCGQSNLPHGHGPWLPGIQEFEVLPGTPITLYLYAVRGGQIRLRLEGDLGAPADGPAIPTEDFVRFGSSCETRVDASTHARVELIGDPFGPIYPVWCVQGEDDRSTASLDYGDRGIRRLWPLNDAALLSHHVRPGFYTLKVTLASGFTKAVPVEVRSGQVTPVEVRW